MTQPPQCLIPYNLKLFKKLFKIISVIFAKIPTLNMQISEGRHRINLIRKGRVGKTKKDTDESSRRRCELKNFH